MPEHSLYEEQPVLLDPTVAADPGLLWFDEDGTVVPSYSDDASWQHRRAKESITIYHLDHTDLTEYRKKVCNDCKRKITEGDEAWKQYSQGSVVAETKFKQIIEDLVERITNSAEYSAAARATIMGLRSDNRPWLDALLTAV